MIVLAFTDLVKSTAIKSLLPGEDLARRNLAYLETIEKPHAERIMSRLSAAGGRAVKNTGDGFFVVFAEPERAAEWALSVQKSHTEAPIATPFGPLEVKIGMHLGAPLPHPDDPDDFIGQEVDLAARLCEAANRSQVLLSDELAGVLQARSGSELKLHAHGLRDLKGIGPEGVFELLSPGRPPRNPTAPAYSPHNLPAAPQGFVGRDALLAEIRRAFADRGVVVLKGEGGMGKTSLAVKAVRDAQAEGGFGGGAAWINCEPRPRLLDCLQQMAEVFFGSRMDNETAPALERKIAEHLVQCTAIVVLDNFETVRKDGEIAAWIKSIRAPACVLVTSREQLSAPAAKVISVHELTAEEARTLFVHRARDNGAPEPEDALAVDRLCEAVGNQPLALELLAARAAVTPLDRLLRRLEQGPEVIADTAASDRDERHRSIEHCIELSFRDLSAPARELLSRTAVLPDGASPFTISSLLNHDDWDEFAAELVRTGVWRVAGKRYTIHPLVRQVAIHKLGEGRAGFETEAAAAIARSFCRRSQEVRGFLKDPAELKRALDWCESELRNLMAALDFAFRANDRETVAQLTAAIFSFFQIRGHWSNAEYAYTLALEAARAQGDRTNEGHALTRLGWVYSRTGECARSESLHRRALAVWSELGDRRNEGHSHKHLAGAMQLRGSLDESLAECALALELLRETQDWVGVARSLTFLGNIHRLKDDWESARQAYEKGLEISRRINDVYDEGEILQNLAIVYRFQARLPEARQALNRSLAIWRMFDDRYNEAVVHEILGLVLMDERRFDEAEAILGSSLAVYREFRDSRRTGIALLSLAMVKSRIGDCAAAIGPAREAAEILAETEDRWWSDKARKVLEELEGSPQAAQAHAHAADRIGPLE